MFSNFFGYLYSPFISSKFHQLASADGISIYGKTGLIATIGALTVAFIYYRVIDSTKFSRPIHWLITSVSTSILFFVVAWFICNNNSWLQDAVVSFHSKGISDEDTALNVNGLLEDVQDQIGNDGDYFHFALVTSAITFLWFFLVSLPMRGLSVNARRTPF